MDKKPINRSSQIQSKAAGDCKKLDINCRPFPRSNRKREFVNEQKVIKNDTQKKSAGYARSKGPYERKQRTRLPTDEGVAGGSEIAGLEENEQPELGSVFSPGSKKQNLNHLLNFMYTPRQAPSMAGPTSKVSARRSINNASNRDMFLQANCQFIVSSNGDYSKQLWDPDLPVPWDLIHQVVIRTEGSGCCPICLHNPVAARATRCGHVYCAPCVLHYLAQSEAKHPPCPVCNQFISADQLKSAQVEIRTRSDHVTMVRIKRQRGSAVATLDETDDDECLPALSDKRQPFARLITATNEQVRGIYKREMKELQDQIMNEIDTSELFYIDQSLESLKRQEELMINIKDFDIVQSQIKLQDEPNLIVEKTIVNPKQYDWFDEESAEQSIVKSIENLKISQLNPDATEFNIVPEAKLDETNDLERKSLTNHSTDKSKYFYFYQAEDGSAIFLHSVNVRMLQAAWGDLSSAPHRFTARVLHRNAYTVTQQTRSRAPYTAHLPLHTPYEVLELDFKPPIVPKEALDSFKDELEKRAKARRTERRRERPQKSGKTMQSGIPYYDTGSNYTTNAPDVASDLHFPKAFTQTSDANMATQNQVPEQANSSKGPSFATMASTSGMWRVRPAAPTIPSAPEKDQTNEDDENRTPAALNLSDAIFAALSAPRAAKKKRGKK